MAFAYIRDRYKVPARRGVRVLYKGRPGVITGCRGCYIKVRLDGESESGIYHPTWRIEYVAA
jgi:hypothetical protein